MPAMATAVVAVADLGEEDLVGRGRGGVGEASKPGGRIGDMSRRGRCIMVGEQSSMSAGLRFWEAAAAA